LRGAAKPGIIGRMAYLRHAFTTVGLVALSACLGSALLSACATTPLPPSLRPMQAAAAPDHDAGDASVYGLYLAGEAAIDRGSSRDAAFYFAKASAADPEAESIRNRAFTSALVAGEIDSAAAIAANIPDGAEPVQGLARLTRAVDALAEGHGKAAEALLAGAQMSPQQAAAAALLKPWAAAEAGDWAVAETLPVIATNPVLSSVADLGRAEILEHEGKFPEAEQAFKAHASGKNGLVIVGYGAFLERRGREADALALYTKALAASPTDAAFVHAKARASQHGAPPPLPSLKEGAAEALIAPAVFMMAQHQGDNGLGYLRLALRLDPHLDEAWVLVGDSMTNAGDADAAREAYEHVKPGSEQYAVARGDLALALQKSGDKTGALELTKATIQTDPKDPRLLTLYADLLSDDNRYQESAAVLDKAIAATGESNADWTLFYLRGASEERAGDWPAAEADLKRSLKMKPDEPEVMNYLGYAWVDRGEHLPEAVTLLEKAEALQPDSGAIVDSLGWARYRTHDYASAIIDLERAVQLDASDAEVNDHLGDVYWRVGRRLEAQYQWRRVLSLNPDDKLRAEVEAKLKNGLPLLQTAAVSAATGPAHP
jgi:tetratricopeptide (TPR) repeat protein